MSHLGADRRAYIYRQRSSRGGVVNHRGRGRGDGGRHGYYNNYHRIQKTIHQNKYIYDKRTSEYQRINGPEGKLRADHQSYQVKGGRVGVGFGPHAYSGIGRGKWEWMTINSDLK